MCALDTVRGEAFRNPDEPIPACNNEGPVRNARQCDAVVVDEILDPPGTAPSVEISWRGTQDAPIFRKFACTSCSNDKRPAIPQPLQLLSEKSS